MNLSWYYEQDTKNEFLHVLNKIGIRLDNLENKFGCNLLKLQKPILQNTIQKPIQEHILVDLTETSETDSSETDYSQHILVDLTETSETDSSGTDYSEGNEKK